MNDRPTRALSPLAQRHCGLLTVVNTLSHEDRLIVMVIKKVFTSKLPLTEQANV